LGLLQASLDEGDHHVAGFTAPRDDDFEVGEFPENGIMDSSFRWRSSQNDDSKK
jgi:hypothetical protein